MLLGPMKREDKYDRAELFVQELRVVVARRFQSVRACTHAFRAQLKKTIA